METKCADREETKWAKSRRKEFGDRNLKDKLEDHDHQDWEA